MIRKNSVTTFLRDFLRGFLSTREFLPLTIEDICWGCPLNHPGDSESDSDKSVVEEVDRCRKQYFATLSQSYLGKPGEKETDWLYSYLKKCEACYFNQFKQFKGVSATRSHRHYLSTASRRAGRGT